MPGFEQVTVTDAEPGTQIRAVDTESGLTAASATVADNGTAVLSGVSGREVELQVWDGTTPSGSAGLITLPDDRPPAQSLYTTQQLQSGFNYIETRDGTLLSAFVTLPEAQPAEGETFPTLVEYSGYSPSDPAAADPARLTLPLLGYALVQVNVRGTGCSGGVYDGFSRTERFDGYDVIETVAAQRWSDGVGMWGISYPGIMQLHVAAARPPSLDAIAPLSVIGSIDDVVLPGGIFNDGFALNWGERVTEGAQALGQDWTLDRVAAGDQTCLDNQDLRVHNPDLIGQAQAEPYSTALTRERSPESFVGEIDVPVYLAGAWQDEQTGGGFTELLDGFTESPSFQATLYNGLHIDPLAPDVLVPLLEFYDLYVKKDSPALSPFVSFVVEAGTASFFGTPLTVPDSELRNLPYADALARYEAAPPIRVLYEVGTDAPGLPDARFEARFDSWPIPEAENWSLNLVPDQLVAEPSTSTDSIVSSFVTDPTEGSQTTLPIGAQIWSAAPGWNWRAAPAANRSRFATEPLEDTRVLTGTAAASLRLRLPDGEPDADIEITLSDIAPDGTETFVQSGWLRLSRRAIEPGSDSLNPQITNRADDIAPLGAQEIVEAQIATLAFAHVFRPGHRLALTIDTPGASRAEWTFDVIPDPVRVEVLAGSSLVLPSIPLEAIDVDIPAEPPVCGSLRAQPCR